MVNPIYNPTIKSREGKNRGGAGGVGEDGSGSGRSDVKIELEDGSLSKIHSESRLCEMSSSLFRSKPVQCPTVLVDLLPPLKTTHIPPHDPAEHPESIF